MLAAAALAAGCAHQTRPASGVPPQSVAGDPALTKALAGRVAGAPQECVTLPTLANHKVYGTSAIAFEGVADDVVYVTRTQGPCAALLAGRAITIRGNLTRLCRGDTVISIDPDTGVEYGGCIVGPFVPYRRPR